MFGLNIGEIVEVACNELGNRRNVGADRGVATGLVALFKDGKDNHVHVATAKEKGEEVSDRIGTARYILRLYSLDYAALGKNGVVGPVDNVAAVIIIGIVAVPVLVVVILPLVVVVFIVVDVSAVIISRTNSPAAGSEYE